MQPLSGVAPVAVVAFAARGASPLVSACRKLRPADALRPSSPYRLCSPVATAVSHSVAADADSAITSRRGQRRRAIRVLLGRLPPFDAGRGSS